VHCAGVSRFNLILKMNGIFPMEWLTETKIPLGQWIASLMDGLNEHADFVFYTISVVLGFII